MLSVAAVAAALLGTTLIVDGLNVNGPKLSVPLPVPSATPTYQSQPVVVAPGLASSVVAAPGSPAAVVTPIGASGGRLYIPSIGVDALIIPTGATGRVGSSAMTIPDNIRTLGLWDGRVTTNPGTSGQTITQENAPEPGQAGVAVIAGHVSSAVTGLGALSDLVDAKAGAAVTVVGTNGVASHWVLSGPPVRVAKDALPSSLGTVTGPPRLAIITCGGAFDSATGHYVDNVIAWAVPA